MKNNHILEDKNYISAKRASEIFGYTSDYVGQLCRAGKLECKMVGRSWFVTRESLVKHQLSVTPDVLPKELVASLIGPSIPVKVVEEIVTPEIISVPEVVIAPETVSAPEVVVAPQENISASVAPTVTATATTTASALPLITLKKFSLAMGVLVIAFVFVFQSSIFYSGTTSQTAASISAQEGFVNQIISFFTSLPKLAMNFFYREIPNDDYTEPALAQAEKPPPEAEWNGLAVVSGSNSESGDEMIKQKIRDSFSDEVEVQPDESGTAGIITPVFRKAKGDDFVYVLVPVKSP